MFTMAGVNLRGRAFLWAWIVPADADVFHYARPAQLWRFASGDVAWLTRTFIAWPHQCRVHKLIKGYHVPAYLREIASPLPGAL